MLPKVGETVLMSLGGGIERPLLITKAHPTGEISGVVFYYYPDDSDSEWAMTNCFYPPSKAKQWDMVERSRPGSGMGEWRRQ